MHAMEDTFGVYSFKTKHWYWRITVYHYFFMADCNVLKVYAPLIRMLRGSESSGISQVIVWLNWIDWIWNVQRLLIIGYFVNLDEL